nr:hypothetical protein [Enhydrobacter sp. AX1]
MSGYHLNRGMVGGLHRLQQRGVSEKILLHPAIAFDYLPKRLQD